jgi:hypothetical protein
VSRLKRLTDNDQHIPLPPLSVHYLVAYLWEMGPTIPMGMGEAPLTHEELGWWQRNTGITLDPWEARVLKRLSRDYHAQAQKSVKDDCPAPYGEVTRRIIVARKIDAAFG